MMINSLALSEVIEKLQEKAFLAAYLLPLIP
jgi:hypothetical protein